MTVSARAAVLRAPDQPLRIEDIEIESPREDELLVKLVSSGICRTDEHAIHQVTPPAVLGHEGAGVVEEVGSAVTKVRPGDRVVMTFQTCGICRRCRAGQPSYCDMFNLLNFSGRRPDGSSALRSGTTELSGHFLGQSAFATHVLANERSVVRLDPESDLRPLGPFGCGFQTGAGAVFNSLRPRAGSSIAIFGAGAVGTAALAASAVVGCHPIIAVDVSRSRLETAARFGASDAIDPSSTDPVSVIAGLAPEGLDYALDTTGIAAVLRQAVGSLNTRGVCGVIGAGASDEIVLDWRTLLNGRTVTGIIGGDSIPELFLPRLIELYNTGRFAADELIEYFDFEDINEALEASATGSVVKPVLTFS